MMSQEDYRSAYHYRAAIEKASGEQIFVDDHTFNPELHEEIVVEEVPPVDE